MYLLNYTKLEKQYGKDILPFSEKISPVPTSNTGKSEIYIILTLNKADVLELKRNKNIKLLNNINIINYYFVKVNKVKKLCKINDNSSNNLSLVLNCLKRELKGFSIMCYLDIQNDNFKNNLNIFTDNNFTEPIVIQNKLCLVLDENQADSYIKEKINYAIQQFQNPSFACILKCKFSRNCLEYLKKICEEEVEIGGEFYISKLKENISTLDIVKNVVVKGTKDGIKIPRIRMNFHSHPKNTYKIYNVNYAWPSKVDFLGFYRLRFDTIFHCVTSLEGIYIMHFNEYWGDKLESIPESIIKKYDFDDYRDENKEDFLEVLNKMNNVKYKGHPVINVKFLKWDTPEDIFEISFQKSQNSCPISQKMFDNYKKTL
jgi:hypothetical protein